MILLISRSFFNASFKRTKSKLNELVTVSNTDFASAISNVAWPILFFKMSILLTLAKASKLLLIWNEVFSNSPITRLSCSKWKET